MRYACLGSLLSISISLALPSACRAGEGDVIALFGQANELFAEGRLLANQQRQQESLAKFAEAADLYGQILASGFTSWPVLYNLGNAQYRQGKLGAAILSYRRAERLAPRNAEIKANIKQAKQLTKDRETSLDLPSFFRSLLFCYYGLNLNEATVLAAIFYFAFSVAEILFIFFRTPALKRSTIVLLVLTVLTAASLFLKIRDEQQTPAGVVTAEDCAVRVGPGEEYHALFTAHEGADIIVLGERADAGAGRQWLRVKVLIETEERTETEVKRISGAEGYVLSSDVQLL